MLSTYTLCLWYIVCSDIDYKDNKYSSTVLITEKYKKKILGNQKAVANHVAVIALAVGSISVITREGRY